MLSNLVREKAEAQESTEEGRRPDRGRGVPDGEFGETWGGQGRARLELEIREAAEGLEREFDRFAQAFGKAEAQQHALNYVRGLMVCPDRKSIEPIAMSVGQGRVSGLQKFINIAPWKPGEISKQMQMVFLERIQATQRGSRLGTFGVISNRGFVKKGDRSAGVARQWNPSTGRVDNCQVGVYLNAVTAGSTVLLGEQLHLPMEWWGEALESKLARDRVHVPKGLTYLTRAETAVELVRRHSVRNLVKLDWLTTAQPLQESSDALELLAQRYVPVLVGIPMTTRFRLENAPGQGFGEPRSGPGADLLSVQALAATLRSGSWRESGRSAGWIRESVTYRVRFETSAGLSSPVWLILERVTGPHQSTINAAFCNSEMSPPPDLPAEAAAARSKAASFFEEATTFLGMSHYETRSWIGWHHHMTLVGLAHLFLTLRRGGSRLAD